MGHGFPIVLRISGDEIVEGGRGLGEVLTTAPLFVQAGVDGFHVSSGAYPDLSWRVIPPTGTALGLNVHLAAALKKAVDVPVMVVGRITGAVQAEEILARGEADMVVLGRALLADPDLPLKAAQGRLDETAPCIGCGLGCVVAREQGGDTTCLVNPAVGREVECRLEPASGRGRWWLPGGGPARPDGGRRRGRTGPRRRPVRARAEAGRTVQPRVGGARASRSSPRSSRTWRRGQCGRVFASTSAAK